MHLNANCCKAGGICRDVVHPGRRADAVAVDKLRLSSSQTFRPLTTDPFEHLPRLRAKVTAPEASQARASAERMAAWDALARSQGLGADWRRSDEALEASRQAMLGACPRDIWVFGYGSLMWDPGVHFVEVRQAWLDGYRRRFNFRTTMGRGSPDQPCLMLGLEPGDGRCEGLAFRIAAADACLETAMLWRREMIGGHYQPFFAPLRTPQGPVEALAFATDATHADFVGECPVEDAAATIAVAAGVLGTNRDYLETLVAHFDELGIEECELKALRASVRARTMQAKGEEQ